MSKKDSLPRSPDAVGQTTLERALAELIVSTLRLDLQPSKIRPETRLVSEGLKLDSMDVLDVALAICRAYRFEQRSDEVPCQQVFTSLRSLSSYVEAHAIRPRTSRRPVSCAGIGAFFFYASASFH